ncbi:Methyltransferase domain-containing protein [Humidesulfovibrio mexicanus]|uniref:Methyltransferase domain-containing protein n=1 Tax=Humidesulfovibrio mexicanus TaxID=147047 RepID=A0A239CK47_9BACT|nr:methyltransferase [Humidesulfovibrio mexicanus]SNS20555.1 Methyltransferase domain-containing protein [Humidesulfovibrio mexicanus]
MTDYVHGYCETEAARLQDQSDALAGLLYGDVLDGSGRYPEGALVLEAGCGTGCQTVRLAAANPHARFLSVDISAASLETAQRAVDARGLRNVELRQADLMRLADDPANAGRFDHAFVCFVLEHLPDPAGALEALRRLIRPGGSMTAIEGDHGSFSCHPETARARRTVECLVTLQARAGGDALIGRRLYPLLSGAGFGQVRVEPRMVYVDGSNPARIEGFSRNTFIAMVRGVRERALEAGLMTPEDWDAGIAEMERAATPEGTFCYTFFRADGVRG